VPTSDRCGGLPPFRNGQSLRPASIDTAQPGYDNGRVKRLTWVVAITAAVSVAGAVAYVLMAPPVAWPTILYLLAVPGSFLAAGIFLLWRHPDLRTGGLLVGGAAGAMAFPALLERVIIGRFAEVGLEGWMSIALAVEALVATVGIAFLALLIGLFPTGVPRSRGEQLFARVVLWMPLAMLLALVVNETIPVEQVAYGRFPPFPNPFRIEGLAWLAPVTSEMRVLLSSAVLAALVVLLARYRSAEPSIRGQIRWVLVGAGGAVLVGVLPFLIGPFLSIGAPTHDSLILAFSTGALLLIPISMTLAIEQPAWIDPGTVIRKSFTYGVLTLGIFIAYVTVAGFLGVVAGARFPLEVAIALTVTLAFAFQPARNRLQAVADRWVFGEQPTPLQAISELEGTGPGDTVDEVASRLADLVRTAARLRWATVTINPESVHTAGDVQSQEPATIIPIVHSGERIGEIRCGPKLRGRITSADTELIGALAGQAGLLIANVRLTGRIVQSQEAERRRIERNIHDGAQQQLAALAAKLGLARREAKGGSLNEQTIAELQEDVRSIHQDLRELAQGIHPSVLSDGGLVEAVEDRCSRFPLEVRVDAPAELRRRRFPDDVEGAAYFFVTEGLANTLKHASASQAGVSIRLSEGDLELTVTDNGVGFDPGLIRHNGLAGLHDRIAGLAGSVSIDAKPGGGVILRASIPVEDAPD
jgi:signal transduction histidine kinase